jgi:hypothetical protein
MISSISDSLVQNLHSLYKSIVLVAALRCNYFASQVNRVWLKDLESPLFLIKNFEKLEEVCVHPALEPAPNISRRGAKISPKLVIPIVFAS